MSAASHPSRRRVAVVLTALAALALGAATPAAEPPGRAIAIGPVVVPRPLRPVRARAREVFEPLLEARLRDAGYRVIPAAVTDSVWNSLRDSVGGFYDPYTGAVVQEKLQAVFDGTRRALHQRAGADGWMMPSIEIVHPLFSGDQARWNGATESTGGRGGLAGFLIGRSAGTLTALSLDLLVEDTRDATTRYRRRGGIQLSTKIVSGSLREVPPDSLLRDAARNAAAVTIALDSLTARWPPR